MMSSLSSQMAKEQYTGDPLKILRKEDIVVGEIYEEVILNGKYVELVKIVGKPFLDEELNIWWIPIKRKSSTTGYFSISDKISLADRGIIPYERGVWNPFNYLRKVK